jgi:hypothetical protein
MGLLDEAIREHLELKRQRGADPGEVAREQREALEMPAREASTDDAELAADVGSAAPLVDPPTTPPPPDAAPAEASGGDSALARPSELATNMTVAGETAELDMSSVLGANDDASGGPERSDPASTQEDLLQWEMPGDETVVDVEAEQPAEDVLEETPDFLRDTPEQERLWFEQRPPRDFDFDK